MQDRDRISEKEKRSTFTQILRNKFSEDDDNLNAEKRMSSFSRILRKGLAEVATDPDKRQGWTRNNRHLTYPATGR